MKKSVLSVAVAASLSAAIFSGIADACTYATFDSQSGNSFTARSMEWPGEIGAQLVVVPRDHQEESYVVKYGYTGITHHGFVSSGMNEHGLSIETLALGEFNALPKGEGDMSQGAITGYVLANAKTVDEAVALLRQVKLETHAYDIVGGLELGIHLALHDGERRVVVEWLDGSGYPEVFENELGVMTNDPNYPAQEGLAKMMLDGDLETGKARFSEETFIATDYSPIGRFQKMVGFNYTQDLSQAKTDLDGVNRAWNMINAVDIPQGALYWRFAADVPQFTSYATVTDIDNKAYYFRTYDNMDIRKVDVGEIDFSKVKYQVKEIFGTVEDYRPIKLN